MERICEEDIRGRIGLFMNVLESTDYKLEEYMVRDYLIKYKAYKGQECMGLLLVDYSPKKKNFNLRSEKLDGDTFQELVGLFSKPAVPKKDESSNSDVDYRGLKAYYAILNRYRAKNFDFSCFGEKLAGYFSNEECKRDIAENSGNFHRLEEYYMQLINKK